MMCHCAILQLCIGFGNQFKPVPRFDVKLNIHLTRQTAVWLPAVVAGCPAINICS